MRPDWCISRQRVWGVPIVVFYCESCSEPFTDKDVLERVVDKFRTKTADVWYSETVAELMGPGCTCRRCGGSAFRKESDILDVWFDSGSSHLAVLTPQNDLPWPADMYIEGGDQYRGWFHSSLLIGVGLKGGSPYRECATHGWTLDAEGRAMSKSLGNIIEPEKIVKQYGADLLRLWVASVDFTEDVRLSDVILTRLSEAYRKLRNTFRYMLGNLSDFDPVKDQLPGEQLASIDIWMLTRAEDLVRRCLQHYEEYAFHKVYRAVYDFAISFISALFVDISKDRLYTAGARSQARRSAQTALYRINMALVRLLAPILSFTCEEVWGYLAFDTAAPGSVHMDFFPNPEDLTQGINTAQREGAARWEEMLPVRDRVLKALDAARDDKVIGAPLEAAVSLNANGDLLKLLKSVENELPTWFITSEVSLEQGTTDELEVKVDRARGDKCERCWRYTTDVGSNSDFPTVCARCASVLPDFLG
jgi:isoleucyl-tRNA synthetase